MDTISLTCHASIHTIILYIKVMQDMSRKGISQRVPVLESAKKMGKFKRVCVFCGSSSGYRKIYSDAASELGQELVERKIDLVYGGGSIGLMGLVAQTVFNGGCHVLGVTPTALISPEAPSNAIGEVLIVSDMHQRKAEMARRADAFIALPGGYGTLEELLEMITWSQLGIHQKPVGLLNVDGYYDSLLRLFDKGVEEGFINSKARNILIAEKTARDLIQKMEDYIPLHEQVAPSHSWNKQDGEEDKEKQNL